MFLDIFANKKPPSAAAKSNMNEIRKAAGLVYSTFIYFSNFARTVGIVKMAYAARAIMPATMIICTFQSTKGKATLPPPAISYDHKREDFDTGLSTLGGGITAFASAVTS